MNNIDINELNKLIDVKRDFLKDRGNGIIISDEEALILEKYEIDYKRCKNVNELIFVIEDYLNDSYEQLDDLELLSNRLSEFNYYNNTNK